MAAELAKGGGEVPVKPKEADLDRLKHLSSEIPTVTVDVDVKPNETDLDRLKHLKNEIPIVYILPNVDMTQVTAAKTAAHQGWNEPLIILAPWADMSQVTAAKTAAHQGWNEPPIVLAPWVDMSQVTAAKTAAHQGWDTTMTVTTQTKVNPIFSHPYQAGKYIGKEITAGAKAANPM